MKSNEPTDLDLRSSEFNAVWNAIKEWDISRADDKGYSGATGTDVKIILNALKKEHRIMKVTFDEEWERKVNKNI
jgi:hypothetical protein